MPSPIPPPVNDPPITLDGSVPAPTYQPSSPLWFVLAFVLLIAVVLVVRIKARPHDDGA